MSQNRTYRIAVNTRLLLKNKLEGIGWFEYHILKNWVETYPEHQFYFIFDRPYDDSFVFGRNVTPIVASPPARHAVLWYIWYEWVIPRILKKEHIDLFVSFDAYTSLRSQVKKITAIHDVAFALFDHQMDPISQWFMRYFTPKYIQTSTKIITVSNATKLDLIRLYNCPESKICVAHNAPSDVYKPLSLEAISHFKSQNTLGCDFFLFIGSIHPRKNVCKLLESFEKYRKSHPSTHKLVLIGRMAWQYENEVQYLQKMKFRDDVILIPHSTPDVIAQWMGSAISLILISKYEGFGVPLVEAMACQIPIICSNVSSMPEVAGSAGILVHPDDTDGIVQAMHSISTDDSLRKKLIENGKIQVKKYTWESAAKIIWRDVETLLKKS